MALLGMIIGGVHSHLAIIGFKIPLHATTYLTISLKTIAVLPQNFTYDRIIIHKNSENLKQSFFNIKS